ncbi:NmrA domain-containing protein [Mycena sanguinolenta]|uniref:NmrA domain-containing protein n=1 Tax=Mycena sanguinolenta TaxID=230812 RepID=A0A8H6XU78_9AGAR|nr:NmrA domain-containing protein [Mycena sanguinolenta]
MHGYSSFAIFGCGLIGTPIAKELVARGASVVMFVRPGTCSEAVRQKLDDVDVHEAEYTECDTILRLLKENAVQVVISTMSAADVAVQNQLASTARAAGVELFVPSEFGVVTDGIGHNKGGSSTIEHLKSIGLPFAIFYAGFFMETIPAMTGFSVNRKINVVGYGNMPCSFTASADVAGFVAHVLTVHHPQDVFNRTFRLQGDRSTLSDLAVLFKTELQYVKEIPGKMGEVWKRMQMVAECGAASTGWNIQQWAEGEEYAGCTNYLWEGHQWQTIKSFYGL